jgi:hypothetical protein
VLPAGVGQLPGEQVRAAAAGPGGGDVLLPGGDPGLGFLIERDQRLAFHLVVEVAQVGGAVGVAGQAVPGQGERVAEPQPAPDQDDGDQARRRVIPPVQVGRIFDLGHDLLGEGTRQPLRPLGVEDRVRGQAPTRAWPRRITVI